MKMKKPQEVASDKHAKMQHPDWAKYSGWVPETAETVEEAPKKRGRKPVVEVEAVIEDDNGDSNAD